jgi:hypothetical protein
MTRHVDDTHSPYSLNWARQHGIMTQRLPLKEKLL